MKRFIEEFLGNIISRDLLRHLAFELRSILSRRLAKPLRIDPESHTYLNLGSGSVRVGSMINIDFFNTKNIDYGMDLRFPFPICSNCVDGIFSEHTFEHLGYDEAANALSESFRILKPGAVIRIIVPDLSILITKYSEGDNDWFEEWKRRMLSTPSREAMRDSFTNMFAICFTASYYHHKSCWDFETLEMYLNNAGFVDVAKLEYLEGSQSLLSDKDDASRRLVSIYIEAKKPG